MDIEFINTAFLKTLAFEEYPSGKNHENTIENKNISMS